MTEAPTQTELDRKFDEILQQPDIKRDGQEYLVNADGSLRVEISREPGGVKLQYLNPRNEPIVDSSIRPGLVDILFDRVGQHTVITFIFENHGFWSGLKLHGTTLRTVFRGPFPTRAGLMHNLGRINSY